MVLKSAIIDLLSNSGVKCVYLFIGLSDVAYYLIPVVPVVFFLFYCYLYGFKCM